MHCMMDGLVKLDLVGVRELCCEFRDAQAIAVLPKKVGRFVELAQEPQPWMKEQGVTIDGVFEYIASTFPADGAQGGRVHRAEIEPGMALRSRCDCARRWGVVQWVAVIRRSLCDLWRNVSEPVAG